MQQPTPFPSDTESQSVSRIHRRSNSEGDSHIHPPTTSKAADLLLIRGSRWIPGYRDEDDIWTVPELGNCHAGEGLQSFQVGINHSITQLNWASCLASAFQGHLPSGPEPAKHHDGGVRSHHSWPFSQSGHLILQFFQGRTRWGARNVGWIWR